MLYVPRHLPNKLEYKVLSCISVHYQARMKSNGIAITPSHPPTVQAGQWYYSRLIIGDLVDAGAWGIVLCVSKIYTCVSKIYTLCIRMGGGGCEQMCTLHAVVVLCVWGFGHV